MTPAIRVKGTGRKAIINARLLDPAAQTDSTGGILIENSKIIDCGAQVTRENLPKDCEIVDAAGACLAPGLVDMRAQLREQPGKACRVVGQREIRRRIVAQDRVVACPVAMIDRRQDVADHGSRVAFLDQRRIGLRLRIDVSGHERGRRKQQRPQKYRCDMSYHAYVTPIRPPIWSRSIP